jgi:rhodanese-related sulfurtransferase
MNAPARIQRSRHRGLAQDTMVVLLVFALAGLIGGARLWWRRVAPPALHPIVSLVELREHLAAGDAVVLDARDGPAFAAGHIPGAWNLPTSARAARENLFNARGLRDAKSRLVIVYCDNQWCGTAEELQTALVSEGHRLVGLFPGGMEAWREAGLSLSRSP